MRFPMQRREICRNHVVDVDEIDVLIRGANDLDGPGPHSRGRPVREDMRRFERMDMRKHRTQPDRAGRACLKHLRFARVSGPVCKPGRGSGRIREIKPIDGAHRPTYRRPAARSDGARETLPAHAGTHAASQLHLRPLPLPRFRQAKRAPKGAGVAATTLRLRFRLPAFS
jgi:hypothetical protein